MTAPDYEAAGYRLAALLESDALDLLSADAIRERLAAIAALSGVPINR